MPHPSILGFTYCTSSGPAAFVNVNTLDTPDFMGTVMHERKHKEQIRRFPNCEAFRVWVTSEGNGARMEGEAFCEEVRLETPVYGYQLSLYKYAEWLAYGYPHFKLTTESATALMKEWC